MPAFVVSRKHDLQSSSDVPQQAMTLPAAREWIARQTGRPVPATSTMWRWTLKGVRGGVRLESFRIGGTTYTTPEMIGRFIERTSQAVVVANVTPAGVEVTSGDRADDVRRKQIAAAQSRLKEICAPRQRGKQAAVGTVPTGDR
jgi:hypothetical protein